MDQESPVPEETIFDEMFHKKIENAVSKISSACTVNTKFLRLVSCLVSVLIRLIGTQKTNMFSRSFTVNAKQQIDHMIDQTFGKMKMNLKN